MQLKEGSMTLKYKNPGLVYYHMQTAKEHVIEMIRKLPETATYEDILYEIQFLRGIDEGLAELDRGEGIPHESVKEQLQKWL